MKALWIKQYKIFNGDFFSLDEFRGQSYNQITKAKKIRNKVAGKEKTYEEGLWFEKGSA
ncbi:hypothetical protein F180042I2_55270 [Enterocloster bolteae]